MGQSFAGPRWLSVLLGLAILLGIFLFVAGVALTHTLAKCVIDGGSAEWESYARDVLLLSCLPIIMLGVKQPNISSLLFFCIGMVGIALAVFQSGWLPNLEADATIGILALLLGLLFRARLQWQASEGRPTSESNIQ